MADDAHKQGEPAPDPERGSMPEGVRVVRKHRKRRSSGGSGGSRETLFLKKREILREMHEEGDGAVTVKEQLQRLKDAKKGKSEVPLEERWGNRKHRRRGTRWVLFAVFLVVIPVVVVLVTISLTRGPAAQRTVPIPDTGLNLDENETDYVPFDSTSPVAWFQENSVEAFDEAVEILDRLATSIPPGLLRDEERVRPMVEREGIGWDAPFAVGDPRNLAWEYGSAGDTGYMVITGRHKDQQPFRAYFVKTDDGLRLDWEATTGRSEVRVEDLVAAAPEAPVLLRAWVGKQPHYDSETGRGSLFSWYQILDPNEEHFVWAYAPLDSPLDREIKNLMNYGLIVLERKDQVRATLRLVKPKVGFRDTEFELVELITEDWVAP